MLSSHGMLSFAASSEEVSDLLARDFDCSSSNGGLTLTFRNIEVLTIGSFVLKPFSLNSDLVSHSEEFLGRVSEHVTH
jgi:hypothetical protein